MQKKYNKWIWTIVSAMALLWIALPVLAAEEQASVSKVAVVNGSVITRDEFDREMSLVWRRFASTGQPVSNSQLSEMEKKVLENLIDRELLFQETQARGIKVEEGAINEQIKTLKKRFPDEEQFKSALVRMNLSEADVRSQIGKGLAIQTFIGKEFEEKASVSGKEAKAYYDNHPESFKQPEQVHAKHILIKVAPEADESQKSAAHKKIEAIQEKLKKGEDFATLAREVSEGPSSVKGGDLGYFGRGQMVKPFQDAAFALAPGEVSGIVETRFGYHLIKVIEKKPETIIAYDEVKAELQEYLKGKKVETHLNTYIKELKGKAKVERFLAEKAK